MVTKIHKINENIKAHEKTRADIEKLKANFENELRGLENQLSVFGDNIDYFKGLTDENFNKTKFSQRSLSRFN